MKYLIFFGFLIIVFSSCERDPMIESELNDSIIHNDLIAGGGTTSFQRIIGGQKLDGLYSVKQTGEGGYVFCGFTENDGASERDILLIKTNSGGETTWLKKFSDTFTDQGWHIEIANDNGFIISATSTLSTANTNYITPYNYNGQLIKTDSSGNQIWKQSFTFGNYTHFSMAHQTIDGGYVVCGTEYGSKKGFLLKTDASGNESWRKTYGGIVELSAFTVTNDGGFILCGSIKNPTTNNDTYIIRTNPTGDTLWTKIYIDSIENRANAIKETASGDFILCGYNVNPGSSGFAKLIDSNGGQIWHNEYSTYDVGSLDNITMTSDNQFIAVGRNNFSMNNKAILQKMDINGNILWIKRFNPRSYNFFNEIQRTTDNGFIFAGYTLGDGFIVKTDGNGN